MKYSLAIDIGATSGRAMLGHYENSDLILEEIHRFDGYQIERNGHLFWDTNKIVSEIIKALCKCKEKGRIPSSLGIDTFGVDYVLLDENDKEVRPVYCYRDSRTEKSKREFETLMDVSTLYQKTGVYPQLFNTLYQLYDDKGHDLLQKTKTIMFLPCYLAYQLTGVKYNELSIASTSGLLNKDSFYFDKDILDLLGLEDTIFAPFKKNGETIGFLKKNIQEEIGFNLEVKNVLSHDTGTGVYGAKVRLNQLFLSSGTWSLLGVLKENYDTSKESYEAGFTNELNGYKQVRYLKNIVGMYIVNRVNQEQTNPLPITEVVELAKKGQNYQEIFDPTQNKFLSPKNMQQAILDDFEERKRPMPKNLSELYFSIYNSLANCYKESIEEIEMLTHQKYDSIVIFGGGSKNQFLNELTEELTNKKVSVGPSEATSIGNILCQEIK